VTTAVEPEVVPYEVRLDADLELALSEGSRHFEERSAVHQTLRDICARLDQIGIPYAVAGGMALFRHGYRRFTEDVDLLVTAEDLKRIHDELVGRGFLPPFTHSKNLRDTTTGVRIEFLITGQYPGDGRPKPVAFPHPASAAVEIGGIQYLEIPKLVELKLASGMTNADRLKDLTDVQELIKLLNLPAAFSEQLDAYVRPKFNEIWQSAHGVPRRYLRSWATPFSSVGITSLDDLIIRCRSAGVSGADELESMRRAGVTVVSRPQAEEGEVWLQTIDLDVARKYDMHDESEFLDP
jgi:hypothetical protein